MIRLSPVAVTLLAALSAASAETGAVKGTITVEGTPPSPAAGAVVMIDGPTVPAPAGAPHAVIDQRRQTFVPHVLAIAVGTTVDFPNHDPMLHNVFSASPAKRFDLGMYGEGETRSVTFDAPGVVRIGCNAHAAMEAFVVVHANPYLAVTDSHGAYTIEGVPPGSHRIRVWHERSTERAMPVVVHAGQVEALDLRLEARR
jgi:plastocyanin